MMDSIMFFIFNPSFYHYLGTEKPQNIVYQRYTRVMGHGFIGSPITYLTLKTHTRPYYGTASSCSPSKQQQLQLKVCKRKAVRL